MCVVFSCLTDEDFSKDWGGTILCSLRPTLFFFFAWSGKVLCGQGRVWVMDAHFWVSDLVCPSRLAGPASGEAPGWLAPPRQPCDPHVPPPPQSVSVLWHLFLYRVFPHPSGCLSWLNSGIASFGKRHLSTPPTPCPASHWLSVLAYTVGRCRRHSASGFIGLWLVLVSLSLRAASTGHCRCLWFTPVVLQQALYQNCLKSSLFKVKTNFF